MMEQSGAGVWRQAESRVGSRMMRRKVVTSKWSRMFQQKSKKSSGSGWGPVMRSSHGIEDGI